MCSTQTKCGEVRGLWGKVEKNHLLHLPFILSSGRAPIRKPSPTKAPHPGFAGSCKSPRKSPRRLRRLPDAVLKVVAGKCGDFAERSRKNGFSHPLFTLSNVLARTRKSFPPITHRQTVAGKSQKSPQSPRRLHRLLDAVLRGLCGEVRGSAGTFKEKQEPSPERIVSFDGFRRLFQED